MAVVDYPKEITDPANQVKHKVHATQGDKFAAFGNLYIHRSGEKTAYVKIPPPQPETETTYLMHISITMLGPQGGDFDQDDLVYADIRSIGIDPNTLADIKPDSAAGFGGVTGWKFGTVRESHKNMGISTYIGPIKGEMVKFRLYQEGDSYAGASYFVLELGGDLLRA